MRTEYQQDGTGPAASQSIIQKRGPIQYFLTFTGKFPCFFGDVFTRLKLKGGRFQEGRMLPIPTVPGYFEKVKIRKKVQGNKPKNWRYYTSD